MNLDIQQCHICTAREICPVHYEANTPECAEVRKEHQRYRINEMRVNALPPDHDDVNHPSHYNQGKIECIAAMEEATRELQGAEAVLTSNIIKYIWRWKFKGGIKDLKKAGWYLSRLIAKLEKSE